MSGLHPRRLRRHRPQPRRRARSTQGDAVAVLDLQASLARHPPPAGVVAIAVDGADEASVSARLRRDRARMGRARRLRQPRRLPDRECARSPRRRAGRIRQHDRRATCAPRSWPAMLRCRCWRRARRPAWSISRRAWRTSSGRTTGPMPRPRPAMIALTKTLALEHAPRVRCQCRRAGRGRYRLPARRHRPLRRGRYASTIDIARL